MRTVRRRTWSVYSLILFTTAFGFLGFIMLFATENFMENIFRFP